MFNGQGQWRKNDWVAFKAWTQDRLLSTDQRLHLLRFKSAVARRRLANLLSNLPPTFDSNAKKASVLFDDTGDLPAFKPEWKPQTVGSRSVVEQTHTKPNILTGIQVTPIKRNMYREIRFLEYFEHLVQKTRFEVERIESEIFWLESARVKLLKNIETVDAQFLNPEFSTNLLGDDSLHQTSIYNPIPDRKLALIDRQEQTFEKINNTNAPRVPNALTPTYFDGVKS